MLTTSSLRTASRIVGPAVTIESLNGGAGTVCAHFSPNSTGFPSTSSENSTVFPGSARIRMQIERSYETSSSNAAEPDERLRTSAEK